MEVILKKPQNNNKNANFSSIQNPGKKFNVYKIKINGLPKFSSLVSNTTK